MRTFDSLTEREVLVPGGALVFLAGDFDRQFLRKISNFAFDSPASFVLASASFAD
jgi:hypothetical protein